MSGGLQHRVGVVGGGVSGMSAAVALAQTGNAVTLIEAKPHLGGRAASYFHPGTGEVIDNCQHVILGCCTYLQDFYQRIGAAGKIRWFSSFTYITPGGKRGVLQPSFLPAPMHTAPSFVSFPHLGWRDKLSIARALAVLLPGMPQDGEENFLHWLQRHHQTEGALRRFWEPVLAGALNDDLDRLSTHYAAMVLREGFLKSKEASRMGLSTVPLSELYDGAVEAIQSAGGEVRTGCSVRGFEPSDEGVTVHLASGEDLRFDTLILAVPFHKLASLLPNDEAGQSLRGSLQGLETSPITSVHLWFDRQVTELDHAVLLDRTLQWIFQKSKFQPCHAGPGSYLEAVVSASRRLTPMSRGEVIELALRELTEFFPAVREAKLVKSTVVKELHATFSPVPGSGLHRLQPETGWRGVFLSGDWTDTGWPSTMEGAVRGGYRTAERVSSFLGEDNSYAVNELPATWPASIFFR